MIIDIIVILKLYLIFLFNRFDGQFPYSVYSYPNKETPCYNAYTLYTTR